MDDTVGPTVKLLRQEFTEGENKKGSGSCLCRKNVT